MNMDGCWLSITDDDDEVVVSVVSRTDMTQYSASYLIDVVRLLNIIPMLNRSR